MTREMRSVWGMVAALLASLGACSDAPRETVPAGAVRQFTTDVAVGAARRVVVLAVDDGATGDAASVREATKSLLRTTFELRFEAGSAWLGSDWQRADLRVVVVHPSAVGSTRAVGPSDDPALAVVSNNASTDDIDAMADAAAREIDAQVAPAETPYPLLDATARTIDLVTGARAPEDTRESELVASLGTPERVDLVLATSRDDEGTEGVDADATRLRAFVDRSAIFAPLKGTPGEGPPGACSYDLAPSTRIAAWAAALKRAHVFADTHGSGCTADDLADRGFLDSLVADPSLECFPAPVAHDARGAGECLVTATMLDVDACSNHPGMLDPRDTDGVRRPRTIVADGGHLERICEIEPLAGEQATACRTSPTCTGCGPGWCDAALNDLCPPGGFLRVVHGATPLGSAILDITCDLANP